MAKIKTYILSPNFTYKPSGPIQIGNIIADPFRPTQILSTLSSDSQHTIDVTTQHEFELADEQGRSFRAGVWGVFLETIGASLGAGQETNRSHTYKATQLETHYLRDEPSEAEVARRTAEPSVQAVIRAGLYGARPVYMVTGVKIARGLSVSNEIRKNWSVGMDGSAPVSESVKVGGELKTEWSKKMSSSFQIEDEDIIFAYQVSVIKEKRRGRNTYISASIFESDAALLHDEVEGSPMGISRNPGNGNNLQDLIKELGGNALLIRREVKDEDKLVEVINMQYSE